MRYDSPDLRQRLAAEYVLGTMPMRARRRLERLMVGDAQLRRDVAEWNARFDPLDQTTSAEEPPARVWRAIERRLELPHAPRTRNAWLYSLAFWRSATLAAAAVAAAAILYVAVRPTPAPSEIVAVLSDDQGDPGWVAITGAPGGDIAVSPLRKVAIDAAHAFELWAIKDGAPHPLGLLAAEPGRPLMVQASLVPTDGVLAVSVEPAGGSPTGLPTGPVPYKGAVLPHEP